MALLSPWGTNSCSFGADTTSQSSSQGGTMPSLAHAHSMFTSDHGFTSGSSGPTAATRPAVRGSSRHRDAGSSLARRDSAAEMCIALGTSRGGLPAGPAGASSRVSSASSSSPDDRHVMCSVSALAAA